MHYKFKYLLTILTVSLLFSLFGLNPSLAQTACPPNDGFTASVISGTDLIRLINCANGNGPVRDTIVLNHNILLFQIDNVLPGYAANANGLPIISSPVKIDGNGHYIARSTGAPVPTFRILEVGATGDLELVALTITNGSGSDGGAIYNQGTLSLINVTLADNQAIQGGGIYTEAGTVTITNSTLDDDAIEDGAALALIGGTVTVKNSIFNGDCYISVGVGPITGSKNLSTDSTCGSAFTISDAINLEWITDSRGYLQYVVPGAGSSAIDAADPTLCPATDERNIARPIDGDSDGNAICDIGAIEGDPPPSSATCPIFPVAVATEDELVHAITCANENTTDDQINLAADITLTKLSGPLDYSGLPVIASNITINGNNGNGGQYSISRDSGAPEFGIIVLGTGHELTLNNVRIANGATAMGAGIRVYGSASLTLENSVIENNAATDAGGAIRVDDNTRLTILNSEIHNNRATNQGGAIDIANNSTVDIANSTISDNHADGQAGAIANRGTQLTIASSTLSGNSATNAASAILNSGTLSLVNATLSGNSAGNSTLHNQSSGQATIRNSTIADNTATVSGNIAGVRNDNRRRNSLTVQNSVVAHNTDSNSVVSNCSGSIGGSSNLADDATCGTTFTNSTTINLGPLQDNGGVTQTQLPGTGSSAIDAGDPANCPGDDQRSDLRPQDGDGNGTATCDVGAVEVGPSTPIASPTPPVCQSFPVTVSTEAELIGAVECANQSNGANVINLGGNITLTAANNVSQFGSNGLPLITGEMTINGANGSTNWRIERSSAAGTPEFRIADVAWGGKLTLNRVDLANGNAGVGGAIQNETGGTLVVTDSTLSNNTASTSGGAIFNSGTLTVRGTTFSNNTGGGGGGLMFFDGTGSVINSTFSNNTARFGGAGISMYHGTLDVTNTTLAQNTSSLGALIASSTGSLQLNNIIIAQTTGPNCSNLNATITGSSNLADDATCGATFTNSSTINLGTLQNNGGVTQTHLPGTGSSAIDAGDPANCPGDDQRGDLRPQDGDGNGTATCDVGAVES